MITHHFDALPQSSNNADFGVFHGFKVVSPHCEDLPDILALDLVSPHFADLLKLSHFNLSKGGIDIVLLPLTLIGY